MNKAEFIEALSSQYDGNKSEAAKALNAVVQTITYQVAGGEKVSITGFGVFEKVARPARMVRNPRTGERKRAKATAVPRFRAGSDLKAFTSGEKKVPRAAKKAAAKAPTTKARTKAQPARHGQGACDQGHRPRRRPRRRQPATKSARHQGCCDKGHRRPGPRRRHRPRLPHARRPPPRPHRRRPRLRRREPRRPRRRRPRPSATKATAAKKAPAKATSTAKKAAPAKTTTAKKVPARRTAKS